MQIARDYLKDSDGDWNAKAMTIATGTYTSNSIIARNSALVASMLVLTTAGSLRITYQVSDDDINWYNPYNSAGQAVNTVAEDLQGDQWITFETVPAEYIRFVFVLTAENSTVSATYRFQETA